MKCPKCGFTSFDDLQDCKKCGSDLTAFKSKFNLRSIPRPFAPAAAAGSEQPAPAAETPAASEAVDFGYDFMEETETEPISSLDDLLEPAAQQAPEGFDLDPVEASAGESSPFAEMDFPEERSEGGDDAPDLESDFNWDDFEEESSEPKRDASEEKSFDLPSLDELPPLDEFDDSGGEGSDFPDFPDLPDFPELDDLEEDGGPKAKKEGEPRDPFDEGGDARERRLPAFFASEASEAPLPAPVSLRLRAAVVDGAVLCLAFALFLSAGEMILIGSYFPTAETLLLLAAPYSLIFFLLCFSYFTLFHSLTGQTVGKMLLGLRVETLDGTPLLFSQAFLRAAGGLLCLLPLGLGYLQILRASDRRGLNDKLAGTVVVVVREEEGEVGEQEYAGV